jgi:hypothetical protein
MATKVKVIKDVTVYDGNRTYGLDAVFDSSGGEEAGEKLVKLGFVEKVGAPKAPGKTEAEKAAEIAAAKRKKQEEAAVKNGLGTAEEVAKLSDQELQELFKAAK